MQGSYREGEVLALKAEEELGFCKVSESRKSVTARGVHGIQKAPPQEELREFL